MSATADYDSLGIVTPAEWIALPIDRPDFDRFCAEAGRRWREEGWDRTTQRRAEILLARIRRDLDRAGVQYAAMFAGSGDESEGSDGTDDGKGGTDDGKDGKEDGKDGGKDGGKDDGKGGGQDGGKDGGKGGPGREAELLLATCVVGTYTKEELGAKVPLSLGNLAMAFGRKPRSDKDFDRITNLEPPTLHKGVPLGASVRLRRMYKLRRPGALPDRFYGETFLVPIGDDGQRCVICHLVTPNIKVSSLFSELFVQIANTLTAWSPDETTSYVDEWVDPVPEGGAST